MLSYDENCGQNATEEQPLYEAGVLVRSLINGWLMMLVPGVDHKDLVEVFFRL